MALFCFVFQIYSSVRWREATSPPLFASPPHFHWTEGKLRPQPGSDVINCLASYRPIKCITLIKSIKEVNKREAGERWCYWSEVLHKWLSLGVSVNRHVGHSGAARVQFPPWGAPHLSHGGALQSSSWDECVSRLVISLPHIYTVL